jgi:hypothetical protein
VGTSGDGLITIPTLPPVAACFFAAVYILHIAAAAAAVDAVTVSPGGAATAAYAAVAAVYAAAAWVASVLQLHLHPLGNVRQQVWSRASAFRPRRPSFTSPIHASVHRPCLPPC